MLFLNHFKKWIAKTTHLRLFCLDILLRKITKRKKKNKVDVIEKLIHIQLKKKWNVRCYKKYFNLLINKQ